MNLMGPLTLPDAVRGARGVVRAANEALRAHRADCDGCGDGWGWPCGAYLDLVTEREDALAELDELRFGSRNAHGWPRPL